MDNFYVAWQITFLHTPSAKKENLGIKRDQVRLARLFVPGEPTHSQAIKTAFEGNETDPWRPSAQDPQLPLLSRPHQDATLRAEEAGREAAASPSPRTTANSRDLPYVYQIE